MKKSALFLFFTFLSVSTLLQAQDLTPPKEGAILRLESTRHEAKVGGECAADIWLIRSNSSRKTKFEGLQVNAKSGISATFIADSNSPDLYTMKVLVSPEVTPGNYTLLVKGAGRNGHKIKGSLVTLLVTE